MPSLAGIANAETPQCEANDKQEGSFFGGRRFNTRGDVSASPSSAYNQIYADMVKSGLEVTNSSRTANLDGKAFELLWNIVIETQGKGSRITVSKMTPGGYATSADFQRTSMCAVAASGAKG